MRRLTLRAGRGGARCLLSSLLLLAAAGASTARQADAGLPPLPPPGHMEKCIELIRHGRLADARALLEPVVEAHPGWARAQFYLGLTYHEEHRYEIARELFERALTLDPDYHTTRVYLGWCLYYLGELDESEKLFESYPAEMPGYPDAIFGLGLIDFDRDDVESAAGRFKEVIRLAREAHSTSTEAKARARLADVLIRLDEWAKAKTELERSIELNPENYETYFKLSRVLERLGDEKGAERARRRHDEVRRRRRSAPPSPMGEGSR